jgi:hypothetical protein
MRGEEKTRLDKFFISIQSLSVGKLSIIQLKLLLVTQKDLIR